MPVFALKFIFKIFICMNAKFVWVLFLLLSCYFVLDFDHCGRDENNNMYINLETQEMGSCYHKGIVSFTLYEDESYRFRWKGNGRAPIKMKLQAIPVGYDITKGTQERPILLHQFQLKSSQHYLVNRSQGDVEASQIEFWTDTQAHIIKKTTDCQNSQRFNH
jgi:hypothetical protein